MCVSGGVREERGRGRVLKMRVEEGEGRGERLEIGDGRKRDWERG